MSDDVAASPPPVDGFKRSRTWGAVSGFQPRTFVFEPAGAMLFHRTPAGPAWVRDVAHVSILKKGQSQHRAKRFDCAAVTGIRPSAGDGSGTTVDFLLPGHTISLRFPAPSVRDTWVSAVIAAGELPPNVCASTLRRADGQLFDAAPARSGGGGSGAGAHASVRNLFGGYAGATTSSTSLPVATAAGAVLEAVAPQGGGGAGAAAATAAASGAAAEDLEPPLPPGWVRVEDGGEVWYEHPTQESRWERPTAEEPPLPDGWVQVRDDGQIYYTNHNVGKSQWDRPT